MVDIHPPIFFHGLCVCVATATQLGLPPCSHQMAFYGMWSSAFSYGDLEFLDWSHKQKRTKNGVWYQGILKTRVYGRYIELVHWTKPRNKVENTTLWWYEPKRCHPGPYLKQGYHIGTFTSPFWEWLWPIPIKMTLATSHTLTVACYDLQYIK